MHEGGTVSRATGTGCYSIGAAFAERPCCKTAGKQWRVFRGRVSVESECVQAINSQVFTSLRLQFAAENR